VLRRRVRLGRLALVLVVWGSAIPAAVLSHTPASAHAGLTALTVESDPGQPPPVVDGICERDLEYRGAWRSPLLYRPRVGWPAAADDRISGCPLPQTPAAPKRRLMGLRRDKASATSSDWRDGT
jgi:hypothetical protein